MVFALHKFKHYLLGNKFEFYVDHMALVYLVNKPHVLGGIVRWLLGIKAMDVVRKECNTLYNGCRNMSFKVLGLVPIVSPP
jgi:hypothetical protein